MALKQQDRLKRLRVDAQDADLGKDLGRIEVAGVAEQSEGAEEVAGGQDLEEHILSAQVVARQLDLAGRNDEEVICRLAGVKDALIGSIAHFVKCAVDGSEIFGPQPGEKLQRANLESLEVFGRVRTTAGPCAPTAPK